MHGNYGDHFIIFPRSHKTSFSLTIFSVVIVAFCCFLSLWQLKRLEEKEVFIYKTSKKLDYLSFNTSGFFNDSCEVFSFWNRRPIFLLGSFDKNTVMCLQARTSHVGHGVNVVSPFHLFSGHTVLFNHGWLPSYYRLLDYNLVDSDSCLLLSVVCVGERQGSFIPRCYPNCHEWHTLDYFSLISNYFGNFYSVPFFVSFNKYASILSYNTLRSHSIPNNHLIYSLTWMSLSIFIIISYIIYSRSRS